MQSVAGGTSIRIFLPDGSPEGVRLVFKSHWTGVAVACPRARYAQARIDRPEFTRPGVYLLIGPDDNPTFDDRIYVGEGEDPRARIDHHHANKDFWTRLVLFTSVGEGLNKAAIRYLEALLLQRAGQAGRAALDNANVPALPLLSEPDRVDAESFHADMLVIYPLLGVNVFEQRERAVAPNDRLRLVGPGASGEGAEVDEGFVVFAGGLARAATVPSTPEWAVGLRHALTQSGTLVPTDDGESLRLVDDHVFKSPSAAAAVLLGRSAAGPVEWKTSSGKTLREIREEAVAMPPEVSATAISSQP